jgi:Family of unknown function (DUF5990)
VLVEIRGIELPGSVCGDIAGVRVGLRVGDEVVDLVSGDAAAAQWQSEVRVRELDGDYDFVGPAVRGRRGERCLGLVWLDADGEVFRAAKLRLERVPATVIAEALRTGAPLVATTRLTDSLGLPICATVPETHLTWTAGTR